MQYACAYLSGDEAENGYEFFRFEASDFLPFAAQCIEIRDLQEAGNLQIRHEFAGIKRRWFRKIIRNQILLRGIDDSNIKLLLKPESPDSPFRR